jgi:uncharacterized phage protein (TIGR01671 family)
MRKIKFRVWDKDLEQFNSPNVHHLIKDNGILSIELNLDIRKIYGEYRFVIQQFSGLTDANGVKIYEGDILRFPITWFYTKDVVSFDQEAVVFEDGAFKWRDEFLSKTLTENATIIGNIFENPELLEQ